MSTSITSTHFIQSTRFFTFRNQNTFQFYQHVLPYSYHTIQEDIDLTHLLQHIYLSDKSIFHSHISFLDQTQKRHIYLGTYPINPIILPNAYVQHQQKIVLTFKPIITTQCLCVSISEDKKKVRQRTIFEAIQAVNEWVQLCNLKEDGKRIYTKKSAANKVGISRKTLKDYYKYLKLSQKYQFDFKKHQKSKIGFMKKFIRTKMTEDLTQPTSISQIIDPEDFWALDKITKNQ